MGFRDLTGHRVRVVIAVAPDARGWLNIEGTVLRTEDSLRHRWVLDVDDGIAYIDPERVSHYFDLTPEDT